MRDKMRPGATVEVLQRRSTVEILQRRGTNLGGRVSHTVYPIKYMVVTGELTTGFTFYGPFETINKAGQWATTNLKSGTFHRVHNMYDVRNAG